MQQLGCLPFGTMPLWNTAHLLPEDSTLGDILHSFLGYAEAPTILQGCLYMLYLLVFGFIFVRMTRKPPTGKMRKADNNSTSPTITEVGLESPGVSTRG
jgi:high-affinity iron transporter